MNLISINDVVENFGIKRVIAYGEFVDSDFYRNLIVTDWWTGGNNLGSNGSYYWVADGRRMEFTDWQVGEPKSITGSENCVQMRKYVEFKWHNANCTDLDYFICEPNTQRTWYQKIFGSKFYPQ